MFNNVPEYMNILCNKIYQSKTLSDIFADDRIVNIESMFSYNEITKDLLRDISKNAHVLQIGLTFGNRIEKIYEKVCKKGKLDIFDISKLQIQLAQDKYKHFNIAISDYNAAIEWDEKYDVIICQNLLKEVPIITRKRIIKNILNGLTKGGKAIFIDTHRPSWWHPFKWFIFLKNRLYYPFAESLWNQQLKDFSDDKDAYRWYYKFYRGKAIQKVIATKKILSSDDVKKLTKLFKNK